jgi:hypothetical protein
MSLAGALYDISSLLTRLQPPATATTTSIMPMQPIADHNKAEQGLVQISGYVVNGDKSWFTLLAPRSGNTYTITHSGFHMVRKGDSVSAVCKIISQGNLALLQPPIVKMAVDRDSVINCLYSAIGKEKLSRGAITRLYDKLEDLVKQKVYQKSKRDGINTDGVIRNVADLLTYLAAAWTKTRDPNLVSPISDVLGEAFDGSNPAVKLLTWWNNNKVMRSLYLFGFTKTTRNGSEQLGINDMCSQSGLNPSELYDRLVHNPYTVPQVTLETCADIDQRTGRVPDYTDYSCGCIVRMIYNNFYSRGWMCTSVSWLKSRFPFFDAAKAILARDYGIVFDAVSKDNAMSRNTQLGINEVVTGKQHHVAYLHKGYQAEVLAARFISARMWQPKDGEAWVDPYPEDNIKLVPGIVCPLPHPVLGISKLDSDQLDGLTMVMKSGIAIITGGAGVGKTTVLKAVVDNFDLNKVDYLILAPTGMAVSRIKQVVPNSKPMTIHRAIASPSRVPPFKKVIIDEMSMVTTELFYDFIYTFGSGFDVVWVGDAGQLPPIGPGSLFNEVLLSRTVTRTILRTCHRTHLESGEVDGILLNCNRIARWPDGQSYTPHESKNFVLDPSPEDKVIELVKSFVAGGVPAEDFMIISPFRKNLDKINKIAQLLYNGDAPSVTDYKNASDPVTWYQGDRVRMKDNNYKVDVMNGEQGVITSVKHDGVVVDFGDARVVDIPFLPKKKENKYKSYVDDEEGSDELTTSSIELSFAITVHSSQGREALFVVFMMPYGKDNHVDSGFLCRGLMYTGLSRARRLCVAVGDMMTLCKAVGRPLPYRCEHLFDRLRSCLPILYEEEEQTQLDVFEDDMEGYPEEDFDQWDL